MTRLTSRSTPSDTPVPYTTLFRAKLGHDAAAMFNYMTGYATPSHLEKISIAPLYLRKTLIEHIEKEMEHAAEGRPGHIWAKLNSLVDDEIIDWLYRASQAGVQIDLVIRGICCLRPGIRGLSDNIRVKSIVGRSEEHTSELQSLMRTSYAVCCLK